MSYVPYLFHSMPLSSHFFFFCVCLASSLVCLLFACFICNRLNTENKKKSSRRKKYSLFYWKIDNKIKSSTEWENHFNMLKGENNHEIMLITKYTKNTKKQRKSAKRLLVLLLFRFSRMKEQNQKIIYLGMICKKNPNWIEFWW